jgi:lipoprotein NlpI
MFTKSALAQEPVDRPALVSALEECESGARESALTARALGACDVLMRSPDLDDAMRARVLVNRGLIAHRRGQAGPARDDLEQAVRLAPDLAPAWLNLSAIRIKAGDASGGMEAARRAESLGADRAQSLFNQAIALETGGRYDAAYDAYVAAAAAAPGNATMQAQPARFRRHQAG